MWELTRRCVSVQKSAAGVGVVKCNKLLAAAVFCCNMLWSSVKSLNTASSVCSVLTLIQ